MAEIAYYQKLTACRTLKENGMQVKLASEMQYWYLQDNNLKETGTAWVLVTS